MKMASEQALELCGLIETLPASEQQTKASIAASKLHTRLQAEYCLARGHYRNNSERQEILKAINLNAE